MIAQTQFTICDLNDATSEVIVGTQTASTSAWTGNASISELKDGLTILYWLPYASTSTSVTLNLTLSDGTKTGAKNVYINGTTRCSTQVAVGNITQLTYRVNTPINGSGSYTGWWITRNQDTTTNYYDRINYKALVTAIEPIPSARIGVFNSDGKLILLSTNPFEVTKPILYIGTAYTASALSQTNNYISWGTAFSLTNTVSGFTGTAGAAVYIKGTLNGTMFTPVSGVLTTTVPTADDGFTYILLGLMSTSTSAVLAPEHPMFRYYEGGFKTISQIAYEAYVAAGEAQEAIDELEIGGRNYLLHSAEEAESTKYLIWEYEVSTPLVAGETYTISMCVTPAEGVTAYGVWMSGASCKQGQAPVTEAVKQITSLTFSAKYSDGKTPDDDPINANVRIYRLPSPASGATVGGSKIHWVKLEKGNRVTDWTAAPEDAEENLELKLAAVHAQISTEADSIRSEVQASYALSSDMSQVREQVGTLAEQTENNYTWSVTRINQLENDLNAATEATEEQLSILRTYMTFGEDGLIIGKNGNPFTFRVVNDRLAFYMNNTEVAYLSNNKLYVTQAEILTKLIIGKFAFEPQSNGNLSLIYNG